MFGIMILPKSSNFQNLVLQFINTVSYAKMSVTQCEKGFLNCACWYAVFSTRAHSENMFTEFDSNIC